MYRKTYVTPYDKVSVQVRKLWVRSFAQKSSASDLKSKVAFSLISKSKTSLLPLAAAAIRAVLKITLKVIHCNAKFKGWRFFLYQIEIVHARAFNLSVTFLETLYSNIDGSLNFKRNFADFPPKLHQLVTESILICNKKLKWVLMYLTFLHIVNKFLNEMMIFEMPT